MNRIDINEPVDIVLPWVDGNDPAWRQERDQWAKNEIRQDAFAVEGGRTGNSEDRFRDWELLKYLFRGIEENLPWVGKVHFVTAGHVPAWLNTENPKLHIVKHTDYIPAEYLPTFSSNAIELNFHLIPGLSERFLLFNDDTFPIAPVPEKAYFKNGLPRDYAIQNARAVQYGDFFFMPMICDAVINRHFPKKQTIRSHRNKWFSPCYGVFNILNLMFMKWTNFTGFVDAHLPIPFTKTDYERAWKLAPEEMEKSCRHRFRRNDDVNDWLIRYIRLCTGNFLPKKCEPLDAMFSFELGEKEVLKKCAYVIRQRKRPVICINDGSKVREFEKDKEILEAAFEEILPKKSGFER